MKDKLDHAKSFGFLLSVLVALFLNGQLLAQCAKGYISDGVGGASLSGPNSVFVKGNYAYVASANSNSLEILDVTDPSAPVHKGNLADGAGGALLQDPSAVYVSGNYAYVASIASSALE